MKNPPCRLCSGGAVAALGWLLAWGGGAHAQVFWPVGQPIPDGSSSGLADTRSLALSNDPILSVSVELSISPTGFGGWTGDLYAYLQHGDQLAVLLNRPGRREGSATGYGDNGPINIRLEAGAAHDVHDYRVTLTGSHTVPLTGALTGTWQPDARKVDPAQVLSSSARTAGLDVFSGMSPAGDWTLFVADLAAGGTMQLDSWSLTVTQVPEPAQAAAGVGGLLLGWVAWRAARSRSAR